ncbi:hypothetical protein V3C99_017752 [Haemonchus contortus]
MKGHRGPQCGIEGFLRFGLPRKLEGCSRFTVLRSMVNAARSRLRNKRKEKDVSATEHRGYPAR